MQILITTLGRADDQRTFRNLPDSLKKKTRLVVQHKERDLYPGYKTIVLPKNITMLSPTRLPVMILSSSASPGNSRS